MGGKCKEILKLQKVSEVARSCAEMKSQSEILAMHHPAFLISMEGEEREEKGNRGSKHQLALPGVRSGWIMQRFI